MKPLAFLLIALAAFVVSSAQAQTSKGCVVSGGTNYGFIVQNCAPQPQIIPLKPKQGEKLKPVRQPDGTYVYQAFVGIVGPIDLRVVACGDDIIDLLASAYPAGMTSETPLTAPSGCIAKQINGANGSPWVLQVRSKSGNGKIKIEAAVGNFTPLP
jgi:hypothetical protein